MRRIIEKLLSDDVESKKERNAWPVRVELVHHQVSPQVRALYRPERGPPRNLPTTSRGEEASVNLRAVGQPGVNDIRSSTDQLSMISFSLCPYGHRQCVIDSIDTIRCRYCRHVLRLRAQGKLHSNEPDPPLITVPALTQHSNSMNQLNKLSTSNQLESSAHGKPSLNSLHQPLVISPQAGGFQPTKFKALSRDNVRTKAFVRYQALGFSRDLAKRFEDNAPKDCNGVSFFVGNRCAINTKQHPQNPIVNATHVELHRQAVILQAFRLGTLRQDAQGENLLESEVEAEVKSEIEEDKRVIAISSKVREASNGFKCTETSKKLEPTRVAPLESEISDQQNDQLSITDGPKSSQVPSPTGSNIGDNLSESALTISESHSNLFFNDEDERVSTPPESLFPDPLRNPPSFVRLQVSHLADLVVVTTRAELLAVDRRVLRKRALQHNE